jgi:hypothetical protein
MVTFSIPSALVVTSYQSSSPATFIAPVLLPFKTRAFAAAFVLFGSVSAALMLFTESRKTIKNKGLIFS